MRIFTAAAAMTVLAFLSVDLSPATAAETKPEKNTEAKEGPILVAKVKGDVTATNPKDQITSAVKEGSFLYQGASIKTGKNSEVVLFFSNGTTISLESNTTVCVDQFLQVPFDPVKTGDFKELKKEPTVSHTKIRVTEGTIAGDVLKLDKKSSMGIVTPLGVAGIRGTKFKLSITKNADGTFSVNVSMAQGSIAVNTTNPTTGEVTTQTLNAGDTTSSLTLTGQVTPGTAPGEAPTATITTSNLSGLTPADQAELTQLFQQIEAVVAALDTQNLWSSIVNEDNSLIGTGELDTEAGTFTGDQGTEDVEGLPNKTPSSDSDSIKPPSPPTPNPPTS